MSDAFVHAVSVGELSAADDVVGCVVNGVPIAIYATDEGYFATADLCTHGAARLSQGFLDGVAIECPLHQGLFDVRTGQVLGPPCTHAVATYAVKEIDGQLYVAVPSSGEGTDR